MIPPENSIGVLPPFGGLLLRTHRQTDFSPSQQVLGSKRGSATLSKKIDVKRNASRNPPAIQTCSGRWRKVQRLIASQPLHNLTGAQTAIRATDNGSKDDLRLAMLPRQVAGRPFVLLTVKTSTEDKARPQHTSLMLAWVFGSV